ncbi:MAG: hypothetical protein Q9166_006333 [cf. Caloplaca sp. 2 TL-2023]
MECTDDALEDGSNRAANIIAERLSQCLASQLPKSLGESPVIDLVIYSLMQDHAFVCLRWLGRDQQQLDSQEILQEEQRTSPDLLPSPPKSPTGESTKDTVQSTIKRRKVVGGLRPVSSSSKGPTGTTGARNKPAHSDSTPNHEEISRQLQIDHRKLPERKITIAERTSKSARSVTTVIASIWKTVYGPLSIDPTAIFGKYEAILLYTEKTSKMDRDTFFQMNAFVLKASTLSKSARALEVVVQAHWMDCYDARIKLIAEENPRLSPTETRMAGLGEACSALGWTQKELRNRMMIWRGYKDVKDAGGWVSLVFAGSGIYSTCKYRIGFEDGLLQRLTKLRTSLEVAADTLHPAWRQLLAPIGRCTQRRYTGHPHDWVVDSDKDAIPLSSTYQQWDPDFTFEHLEQCTIDDCWHGQDPRCVHTGDIYVCSECGQKQSEDLGINKCGCFRF